MKNKMIKLIIIFIASYQLHAVNFSEDISPIIYNNCTECHRQGEIGAFLNLTNYSDVYDNRHWILSAIATPEDLRHGQPIMPPWQPDREYSSLVGERFLTDEQVQIFSNWIDQGGIQGNPSEEYPIPEFPEGSAIGDPDFILTMEESTFIEGNYEDYYRCFVFESISEDDLYITAMEVRPGNSEAVHHTLVVAVPPNSADQLESEDSQYGYDCYGDFRVPVMTDFLGGYAPGTKPNKWKHGLAQKIPAGWDLIVQMHYAPVLDDMEDLSEVNIFTTETSSVEREVETFTMINTSFVLPPHQITEIHETIYVPDDLSIVSFFLILTYLVSLGRFLQLHQLMILYHLLKLKIGILIGKIFIILSICCMFLQGQLFMQRRCMTIHLIIPIIQIVLPNMYFGEMTQQMKCFIFQFHTFHTNLEMKIYTLDRKKLLLEI